MRSATKRSQQRLLVTLLVSGGVAVAPLVNALSFRSERSFILPSPSPTKIEGELKFRLDSTKSFHSAKSFAFSEDSTDINQTPTKPVTITVAYSPLTPENGRNDFSADDEDNKIEVIDNDNE